MRTYKYRKNKKKSYKKQKGGNKSPFVSNNNIYISGEGFKNMCKYNLDDRYPITQSDDKLKENDLVFIKQSNINDLLTKPPSKKIRLVVHNTDETFDDSIFNTIKQYTNSVYAVNSSAQGVIQIPLGFRDNMYTPHKVLDEVYNTKSDKERDVLCLLNFSIHGDENSERSHAHRAFKDFKWVKVDTNITPQLHIEHTNPETIRLRNDFYNKLKQTKFVICPFGAGKDTHRVYESLFFGCIPVIKTSFLDSMYNDIGGCWIVNDWSEVTEEECNKQWKNKKPIKLQTDVNYWLSKVSTK
jgi:hypothetical protein